MKVSEFVSTLEFVRGNTNYNAYRMLWNLIDSHDCPRFITCAGGDVRKLKLAALLQFTFTGTPLIYYGDEVGMSGGADPDCRQGMIWDSDKINTDVLNYYRRIIKLRNNHPSLKNGEFVVVYKDDDKHILVYKKVYKDETLFVALNNSDEEVTISNLTNKINLINGEIMDGKLLPFTGVIFE
jgi:glycosidase